MSPLSFSPPTGARTDESLVEVMTTMRAMRRLRADPVPDDLVRELIEAAMCAPSAGHQQGQVFIVVTDRDRIARALQNLGEKQREAVRLAYDEGLTQLEIAQRLNEPLGTIKSRLSNAVWTLRAEFMAQGELR